MIYESPEKIRGKSIGPFSDQYQLAVTLYELISGDIPFHGIHDILTLIPVEIRGIPQHVNNALLKVLSKEPKDRYNNVREFKREILNSDRYDNNFYYCIFCGKFLGKDHNLCSFCNNILPDLDNIVTKTLSKCKLCGHMIINNASYCHSCGNSRIVNMRKINYNYCHICGESLQKAHVYCPQCNNNINYYIYLHGREDVCPTKCMCPSCGNNVFVGSFCYYCGNKLSIDLMF